MHSLLKPERKLFKKVEQKKIKIKAKIDDIGKKKNRSFDKKFLTILTESFDKEQTGSLKILIM